MEQQFQQNPQNQQYNNMPNYQYNYGRDINTPLTVGQWVGTLLLLCIPIVNLILLFVWGFSEDTNISKKNFAKAYLIMMAIGVGISILLGILFFIFALAIAGSAGYYY
jgi:hypothetical protein